jgi:hypothetical protein
VPRFEPDPSGDDKWHTDMSSVRFHSDWLVDVAEEVKNPTPLPPLTCSERQPRPKPPTGRQGSGGKKGAQGAKTKAAK